MPYCDRHNEVYRGEKCPVCAGDKTAGNREDDTGSSTDTDNEDGDIDDFVNDAIESVTENLDVDEAGGDIVAGSQEKSVEKTDVTDIDQSTTVVDDSTETHDENTTVEDSVVNRSDIDGGEGSTEVADSVINRSNVGGSEDRDTNRGQKPKPKGENSTEDSASPNQPERQSEVMNRHGQPPQREADELKRLSEPKEGGSASETKFCLYCGEEIPEQATCCPICDEELET